MNKLKSFLSKDIKDYNKVILSFGCITFLLCVGILSYFISSSFALFSGEVSGSRNIKMRYTAYTKNFSYKGEPEEYKVKTTGYYYIELGGAQGGDAQYNILYSGGYGAKTSGYIYLEKDTKLYFYVGGQGQTVKGTTTAIVTNTGYNSGSFGTFAASNSTHGGGGGATDVRLVGGSWNDSSSLRSRIMVAAGGGGASSHVSNGISYSGTGGDGGTLYGGEGIRANETCYSYGNGAKQVAGGTATQCTTDGKAYTTDATYQSGFGDGGGTPSYLTGISYAGGGGGYYGGSGGYHAAGGGGSSYISGYAGVNSITDASTITHTAQTKHYSNKYFIGGEMIASQNKGNGYAKIRYVGTKPARKNTKLNSVRYIKSCMSYNTANQGNHWVEIQAIKDGVNVAKGKTVTGTVAQANTTTQAYSNIVDGLIDATGSSGFGYGTTQSAGQCVTVDLGQIYELDEVAAWNYFNDFRRYISNDVTVSSDNSTWTSLAGDEVWRETSNGARWNAYIDHINGYRGKSIMTWWLDGYANTGTYRNTTTTNWKNYASGVATNYAAAMNGTAAGASWGPKYLNLDGTNDWVKVGTANYTKPTIEAVVSPTKTHTAESDIAANWESGGYGIYFGNNNTLTGSYYISSGYRPITDTVGVPTNSVVNIATSYDQTNRRLYKQGELIQSDATYTGAIGTTTNSTIMAIGTNPGGSAAQGSYFQGKVYSFRLYNGVLTDEQLYHNYLYDKQLYNLD